MPPRCPPCGSAGSCGALPFVAQFSRHDRSATGAPGQRVSAHGEACLAGLPRVSRPGAPGQLSFANLSPTCVGCHLADYNKAVPPHAASGFPTDCASCHSPRGWQAAAFDHSRTQFPLTGTHRIARAVNRVTPTTSIAENRRRVCPVTRRTTTPRRTRAIPPLGSLPIAHPVTRRPSWPGAKFNHDASFFPIYSGAHAGRWSSCATCHTNATNFAVFNCLSCHTKTQTDSQHSGRNGYVYASQNCYACHPRGRCG